MADNVKCIGLRPVPLPTGALLHPGHDAEVNPDDPVILSQIEDGVLAFLPSSAPPEGSSKDVLDWVGDDQDKAREALAVERASDSPRSTLISELEKLAPADEETP